MCALCDMSMMDVETLCLIPIATHIDSRPLSTHSVSFFLSQSRLSLLWAAAVVSPPDLLVGPHAPITTILPYTYSTPYSMLAFICNTYILLPPPACFSVPTLLTPVTVTL